MKVNSIFSVQNILEEKNLTFINQYPQFIQNYINRLFHEEKINLILKKFKNDKNFQFVKHILDYNNNLIQVNNSVALHKQKNYIFVANHPTGILDGLVLLNEIGKHYNNVKFIINDILTYFPNMNDLYLPIDWVGKLSKKQVKSILKILESDIPIIIFPSGEVSKISKSGIKDLLWNDFFIKNSIRYKRDIIPIYINGSNSIRFHMVSILRRILQLKFNFEMFFLIDEFFNQKNKVVEVTFGEPISYEMFSTKKTSKYWANYVKKVTYSLAR